MKQFETLLYEIRIYDDNAVRFHRKDRKKATAGDKAAVRTFVANLHETLVEECLAVFPGARIVSDTRREK